jgi:glycosyltransferase involved in cell wall biosynthesis
MIIQDDGSKDDIVEIIKQFCERDNHVKLVIHQDIMDGLSNFIY